MHACMQIIHFLRPHIEIDLIDFVSDRTVDNEGFAIRRETEDVGPRKPPEFEGLSKRRSLPESSERAWGSHS